MHKMAEYIIKLGGGVQDAYYSYFLQNLAYRFLWKVIIYKINVLAHKKKHKLQVHVQGSVKDILTSNQLA